VNVVKATYGLVVAETGAFLLSLPYLDSSISYLGFSTSGLLHGEVWTLLTSLFIHVDLFHLAFNMFFLLIFGAALEPGIGARKTMGIFFIAGVASLPLGAPFYPPDARIVGASVAVSGLVGAAMVITPNKRSILLLSAPLGLAAVVYLIFNAFMLLSDQSGGVAYPSHIIGFVIGVALGFTWRRSRPSGGGDQADRKSTRGPA